MNDNSYKSTTAGFPAHAYGDTILEALRAAGIAHPVVIVIVGDASTGDVSTSTNLEDESELSLLKFVLASREEGTYTAETLLSKKLN